MKIDDLPKDARVTSFRPQVLQQGLQKILIRMKRVIPNAELRAMALDAQIVEYAGDKVAAEFKAAVWGEMTPMIPIEFPETWKDAVKLRFFPAFLLRRFPARVRRIVMSLDVFYPTLNVPTLADMPRALHKRVHQDEVVPVVDSKVVEKVGIGEVMNVSEKKPSDTTTK